MKVWVGTEERQMETFVVTVFKSKEKAEEWEKEYPVETYWTNGQFCRFIEEYEVE